MSKLVEEFGSELLDMLFRYESRGLHHEIGVKSSLVDDEPDVDEEGNRYPRSHRGPQARISLTVTDTADVGEYLKAHYRLHNVPLEKFANVVDSRTDSP